METPQQIDLQGVDAKSKPRRHHQARRPARGTLRPDHGRPRQRESAWRPSPHRRAYEISIRLSLPEGRQVNIGRTPQNDERYSKIEFALNDAFKRARRQLQDQVRELQGQVKQHDGPPIGTVSELDPLGEFGLIETGDGREIYFHRNSVLNGEFAKLSVGSRVTFAEEVGDKGPQASTVKLMGKHSLKV